MNSQALEIVRGIRRNLPSIRAAEKRHRKWALSGFPFDAWLLQMSPLYRRSRQLYFAQGGRFMPSVISSPRTLSSDALLSDVIEYSPIAEELYWSATDRIEKKNPKSALPRVLELRTWCAPVFHEQSHRILWHFLPSPPTQRRAIHRYLNFCEALVIAADMALGDQLGKKLSRLFYLTGSTYDPGTDAWTALANRRAYRNYLHDCVYATYLNLELWQATDIRKIIRSTTVFTKPNRKWPLHAVSRCLRLDRGFVEITNLTWQDKHWSKLKSRPRNAYPHELDLAADPLDHRLVYFWAEKWFDHLRL